MFGLPGCDKSLWRLAWYLPIFLDVEKLDENVCLWLTKFTWIAVKNV